MQMNLMNWIKQHPRSPNKQTQLSDLSPSPSTDISPLNAGATICSTAICTAASPATNSTSSSTSKTICDIGDKVSGPRQTILSQYPRTAFGSQYRHFSNTWFLNRPWLEYSVVNDSAYCFACRNFITSTTGNNTEESFISKGFRDWKKAVEKFNKHANCRSHCDAVLRWREFESTETRGSVVSQLSSIHQGIVTRNREYMSRLIEVVLYLAQQGLAFRGDSEKEDSHNKGNFLELIDLIRKVDPVFKMNSESMPENAHYLSPVSQNDILNICARSVKDEILKDIRNAGFIAVLADGTRDVSKKEQISICFRFVSPDLSEVREEFISYAHAEKLNAKTLANLIISQIRLVGLNDKLVIAQCYDGAAVMSGANCGVQKLIRELFPNALYTHCAAHRLNLVLVDTVSDVPIAFEFFSLIEAMYTYISRPNAHERFVKLQLLENLRVRELQRLSDTRWSCRWCSVNAIKERLSTIISLLSDPEMPKEEVIEARGLLSQILTVNFISSLIMFDRILSITHGLSETLQATTLNIGSATQLISAVKNILNKMRLEDAAGYTEMLAEIKTLCNTHEINLNERTSRRKRKLNEPVDYILMSTVGQRNDSSSSYEETFRQKLLYPVLDCFLSELDRRFTEEGFALIQAVQSLLSLDSPNFLNMDHMEPILSRFGEALNINSALLSGEIAIAKEILRNVKPPVNDLPRLFSILSDDNSFHHLRLCMRLALTLPVSTATCERSFSALKLLKTYLRNRMTDERLNALTLLYISKQRTASIDPSTIINNFAEQTQRAVSFH